MRVIVREAAYHDLERIHAWIAKDRPRAADAAVERILQVVPGSPYILVYEVHAADRLVAATAVFHGAQNREHTKDEM